MDAAAGGVAHLQVQPIFQQTHHIKWQVWNNLHLYLFSDLLPQWKMFPAVQSSDWTSRGCVTRGLDIRLSKNIFRKIKSNKAESYKKQTKKDCEVICMIAQGCTVSWAKGKRWQACERWKVKAVREIETEQRARNRQREEWRQREYGDLQEVVLISKWLWGPVTWHWFI